MNKIVALFTLTVGLIVGGCSSLLLQPANFSWAAEEILDVTNGMVSAQRYSVEFNVKPLLAKEFGADSAAARNTKIVRVIRDKAGFYYVTAPNFKNVYVFAQSEGGLSLANTIAVSPEKPMNDPKFNQRGMYIELLNGNSTMQLTKAGTMQGGGR
jgi:hypothetical protein